MVLGFYWLGQASLGGFLHYGILHPVRCLHSAQYGQRIQIENTF